MKVKLKRRMFLGGEMLAPGTVCFFNDRFAGDLVEKGLAEEVVEEHKEEKTEAKVTKEEKAPKATKAKKVKGTFRDS